MRPRRARGLPRPPRSIAAYAAVVLALTACRRKGPPASHERLDPTAGALRSQLNSDVGKVRLLMLLSPADEEGLGDIAEIDRRLFETTLSDDLRAYVVWGPQSGAEEQDVTEATRSFKDIRGSHYWDYSGRLFDAYAVTLRFSAPARGAVLLFGPNARWEAVEPPAPDVWMQLTGSASSDRRFDAAVCAKAALERLPTRRKPAPP